MVAPSIVVDDEHTCTHSDEIRNKANSQGGSALAHRGHSRGREAIRAGRGHGAISSSRVRRGRCSLGGCGRGASRGRVVIIIIIIVAARDYRLGGVGSGTEILDVIGAIILASLAAHVLGDALAVELGADEGGESLGVVLQAGSRAVGGAGTVVLQGAL